MEVEIPDAMTNEELDRMIKQYEDSYKSNIGFIVDSNTNKIKRKNVILDFKRNGIL